VKSKDCLLADSVFRFDRWPQPFYPNDAQDETLGGRNSSRGRRSLPRGPRRHPDHFFLWSGATAQKAGKPAESQCC